MTERVVDGGLAAVLSLAAAGGSSMVRRLESPVYDMSREFRDPDGSEIGTIFKRSTDLR